MPVPGAHKKEQRKIPDPAQWMRDRAGAANGPANAGKGGSHPESQNPMSPGATGKSMPTQHGGRQNGTNNNGKSAPPKGQAASARSARGSGKSKSELSPNNHKKAGSMVKGKSSHLPTRDAIERRLHPNMGASKATSATRASGRSGILSKFEGFSPNNG